VPMRRAAGWMLVMTLMVPLVVVHAAVPAGAVFSVRCDPSHRSNDDPIVFPGQPGAAHEHLFFANRTTDAFSTFDSMRAGGTTCPLAGDTAGYWVPTLSKDGVLVMPRRILAYYRVPAKSVDPASVIPFPPDFRMVAGGTSTVNPYVTPTFVFWSCTDNASTRSAEPQPCPNHTRITIAFPSCWDGMHIDSADHRSHVAYPHPRTGCPASHPQPIPRLALTVVWFNTNLSGATFSSGGSISAHADFWNTWNQAVLTENVVNCINTERSCIDLKD
jgi:hypothetical protein